MQENPFQNKRTTVEHSQSARAKESLPLRPLLSASPWSIVLPLLQVGFLQIVIKAHIFSKGYNEGMWGSCLGQRTVDATKCFCVVCRQLCFYNKHWIYRVSAFIARKTFECVLTQLQVPRMKWSCGQSQLLLDQHNHQLFGHLFIVKVLFSCQNGRK